MTSGNLTVGGLVANFEYGVVIEDAATVQRIRGDVLEYASLGAVMDSATLSDVCAMSARLKALGALVAKEPATRAMAEMSRAIDDVRDRVLLARLSSGPIHTVFTRTIEYLLRTEGAMITEALHSRIEQIHPDLCDNSVDRVINGERFGKKWKHAVRTAQQMLKSRGRIQLRQGMWSAVA